MPHLPTAIAHGLRLTAAVVLAALTACAQPALPPSAPLDQKAERMFERGYDNMREKYIEDVPVSQLALDGLRGLSTIDPDLEVTSAGGDVVLISGGRELSRLPAPREGDVRGWAVVMSRTVLTARETLPKVREADEEAIYKAVFDRSLADLDGFSRYLSAAAARDEKARRFGFHGIGIRIKKGETGPVVVSVMPGTPAERAGIRAEDGILTVDGSPVSELELDQVVDRLRGPSGSAVRISLRRTAAPSVIDISVQRTHIVPPTVSVRRDGAFLYVQLTGFNSETAMSMANSLESELRKGGRVDGIVLDLRDNPGGLLDQAVEVADLFLSEGVIVSTRGRHPDSFQAFTADEGDVAGGIPMAVLINGNTASAAEILAAALQDNGRAVVIGSNSFGKGTVQTLLPLPNEGELIVTWSRIHAPSGYTLHRLGVMPSVCTSGNTEGAARVLERLSHVNLASASGMISRWRHVDHPDAGAVKDLRASCPADGESRPEDVEVAESLLGNPGLFGRALSITRAELARR